MRTAILIVVACLLLPVAAPAPAPAQVAAVQVTSAWGLRPKRLAALLRYELTFKRNKLFHDNERHTFVPRIFGLGTGLARPQRELIIEIPALPDEPGEATIHTTIRERRAVDRLLRSGQKARWVPADGWDRRPIVVNLAKAQPAAAVGRRRVKRQVERFFKRIKAFRADHPTIGGAIEASCGWALDVTEQGIDDTIVGLAEARAISRKVLHELPPPSPAATEPSAQGSGPTFTHIQL